jgi:SagB-type dehydrogenase family enzyme
VTGSSLPTIDVAARIFGDPLALDDPAESFHEASRLAPSTVAARMAGSARLAAEPLLQVSATRASRRHPHRAGVDLARSTLPRMPLRDALDRRRSGLGAAALPLRRRQLSALLSASYAARLRNDRLRRPVPSAGGLYPLELYPVVRSVSGVKPGVYHYDPYVDRIELLGDGDPTAELAAAVVDPELAREAALTIALTAVFPRVRFKYGQRGYRFALLEAGHLAQNLVLTAAALRLAALPYGGFYDRRIDAIVGADGIDECSVYVLFFGERR